MKDPAQWRLSPAETDVMDAIVETGRIKGAAAALGKSAATVREQVKSARRKMGIKNTLLAAVAWDRYSRMPAP